MLFVGFFDWVMCNAMHNANHGSAVDNDYYIIGNIMIALNSRHNFQAMT